MVVKCKWSVCTSGQHSDGHVTKEQTLATQSQLQVPY